MALPLHERMSGIKQLQLMTKLSPLMYWFSCFFWDYIFCYIPIVILILITMYSFDEYQIFTSLDEISKLIFCIDEKTLM